jgi:hypothetical protein
VNLSRRDISSGLHSVVADDRPVGLEHLGGTNGGTNARRCRTPCGPATVKCDCRTRRRSRRLLRSDAVSAPSARPVRSVLPTCQATRPVARTNPRRASSTSSDQLTTRVARSLTDSMWWTPTIVASTVPSPSPQPTWRGPSRSTMRQGRTASTGSPTARRPHVRRPDRPVTSA